MSVNPVLVLDKQALPEAGLQADFNMPFLLPWATDPPSYPPCRLPVTALEPGPHFSQLWLCTLRDCLRV